MNKIFYSYDLRSRLIGIALKKSNNDVLSTHEYVYDAVSNIVSRTSNGVTTEFTYDLIDQLRTETRNDYEAEYTYDANGNRLTRTVNNVTEDYEYDDADKLLSVSINENPVKEYTYDACGRLIEVEAPNQQITQLHWDYEDRLIGITYPNSSTNTFGYNPFGARVSKSDSSGTSTYFRAGTSVISPVFSDGSATYTPGISERRNNNSTFYHSDLKNTTTQTASNETISGTNQYDAFGNLIDYSGTWNGPFAYGGKFGYQSDDDSGLMLLGHRYYDSSTGRFISRDPIGDGANWYVYCGNNPITNTDPTGELAWFAIGALFVFLVAPTDIGLDKGEKPPPPGWQQGFDTLIWSLVIPIEGFGIAVALKAATTAYKAVKAIKTLEDIVGGAKNANHSIALSLDLVKAEKAALNILPKVEGATLKQANRLAKQYGGSPSDWVKVASPVHELPFFGIKYEAHWYYNVKNGMRVEEKVKFVKN